MARVKKITRIEGDIARLEAQLRQAKEEEAGRIGELAVKAGLADIEISDRDLIKELRAIASRFRAPAENA